MRANAEMLSNLSPQTPVIADANMGYGGPIMVARTMEQYSRSGVAGFHIEDQVQTKRCGHLGGKILVDRDIRAAVQARQRMGSDIVVIARTDALGARVRGERGAAAGGARGRRRRGFPRGHHVQGDGAAGGAGIGAMADAIEYGRARRNAVDLGGRGQGNGLPDYYLPLRGTGTGVRGYPRGYAEAEARWDSGPAAGNDAADAVPGLWAGRERSSGCRCWRRGIRRRSGPEVISARHLDEFMSVNISAT